MNWQEPACIKLVAKGGIEPPTRGFSIHFRRYADELKIVEKDVYKQLVKAFIVGAISDGV
jgi:hypothetical protein